MRLVYKQLYRQLVKDKLFLSLLFLLAMLTSMSFFFVIFSIDGNMALLNSLESLTENQQLYKEALNSNTTLAYSSSAFLTVLSSFVFVMFFYRYFRTSRRQIGCIKALGFKDLPLRIFFAGFTAILSLTASVAGLPAGYYLSDILINAGTKTYLVTGLTKNISFSHLITGLGASAGVYCLVTFFCWGFIKNKETGVLLQSNHQHTQFPVILKTADRLSRIAPPGKRLSLRIALRKPLSVLLLFAASMSFHVCIILGQSLNISSGKIFAMQTEGHNYEYDIQYSQYQTNPLPKDNLVCLDSRSTVFIGDYQLERRVTGLYDTNDQYWLKNPKNETLAAPERNTAYITPEFSEIYGVKIGDTLTADIAGTKQSFMVTDIAVNGVSKNFYICGQELSEVLGVSPEAYNRIYSTNKFPGNSITTKAQRVEELKRNSVSNQVSAVINQFVGVLVGSILIFLALYVNFQDNTHDILILSLMGYRIRDIRRILIDVYLPVLWASFLITIVPGILLAKSIQKSLSISTNDYMPFGTGIFVILTGFVLMNVIYQCVLLTFGFMIKRTALKNNLTCLFDL